MSTCLLLLGALQLFAAAPANDDHDEMVIEDFEGDFDGWKVEGNAFGDTPATGTLPGQQAVSGYEGEKLVNSFHGGDKPTGRMTSRPFTIDRPYLNVLVGGGYQPEKAEVRLLIGGKIVARATGNATTGSDDEHLSWRSWDISKHIGQQAAIEIVDEANGSWGHINVDDITLSRQPRVPQHSESSVARAMSSVLGASSRAASDPLRPSFHLMPPALWCNDPNGPIYHDGWFHIFYQHNPYGDRWEHMHWGHARSKDLVHWEHLPIALWPSTDKGENHVFSGSAAVNGAGKVMLFYTSIGNRAPEQWGAVSNDDELIDWTKLATNPLLTEAIHGKTKIDEWRDPFVFQANGKHFMVCGGHPRGEKGSIMLYEADDPSLAKWSYRGVAFRGTEPNWECPNLFEVNGNWLLMYSPHGPVKYYTGQFDPVAGSFSPKHHGDVDHGGDFYATSACTDPNGRWIVWGWIRGFPGGRGWNGCLSLPRIVTISGDGKLLQEPAPELRQLRQEEPWTKSSIAVSGEESIPLQGRELEIEMTVDLQGAERCGLKLLKGDSDKNATVLFVDRDGVEVAGDRAPRTATPGQPTSLHIFVDRLVVEVFVDGQTCLTKVVRPVANGDRIALFSSGGEASIPSIKIWKLDSKAITAPQP